ncbi:hypothetical protein ACJX0J_026227, partial [Zea mays]
KNCFSLLKHIQNLVIMLITSGNKQSKRYSLYYIFFSLQIDKKVSFLSPFLFLIFQHNLFFFFVLKLLLRRVRTWVTLEGNLMLEYLIGFCLAVLSGLLELKSTWIWMDGQENYICDCMGPC